MGNPLKLPPDWRTRYSFRRRSLVRALHSLDGLLKGRVLDVGGTRKRPDDYRYPAGADVSILNISIDELPHVVAMAEQLSVRDGCFDAVMMTEVLEHLYRPEDALKDAFRALNPGGLFISTTPFLYKVHAHPEDYRRFAPFYYERALGDAGFTDVRVAPQDGYFAVLATFGQELCFGLHAGPVRPGLVLLPFLWLLLWLDGPLGGRGPLRDYTTGYTVTARKPE